VSYLLANSNSGSGSQVSGSLTWFRGSTTRLSTLPHSPASDESQRSEYMFSDFAGMERNWETGLSFHLRLCVRGIPLRPFAEIKGRASTWSSALLRRGKLIRKSRSPQAPRYGHKSLVNGPLSLINCGRQSALSGQGTLQSTFGAMVHASRVHPESSGRGLQCCPI